MNALNDSARQEPEKAVGSAKAPLELRHWWARIVFGRYPRRTLLRLAYLTAGSFITFKFLLLPIRITGHSMKPTYRDGRINFVNRLSYLRSKPRRGDVVGIRTAGEHVLLLKRVIGLPGERIAIVRGVVYIDAKPLEEPYVKYNAERFRRAWWESERQLEDDEYFVIGDNRAVSDLGGVYESRILGKVLF